MNHTLVETRLAPVKSVEVVTAPTPTLPPPSRWPAVAVASAVLLGVFLRVLAFASDRPLWLDEAMIALNLTDRDFTQLFEPLDRNQTGPVAFLVAGKVCVTLFGTSEHALRLPALVGSVLGMSAFAVAAVRLLPPWPARLAVLLFALSPTVVNYAAEVKQYSTDAATTAALLAVCAPLLRSPTRGRFVAAAFGGAAAVWVSHPAVFVLAAVGTVLFARALRRREHRLAVPLVGVAWLVSFAAVYWVNVRHGANNPFLAEYWAGYFLTPNASALPWLSTQWVDFFRAVGGYGGTVFPAAGLAAVLALVGAAVLWRDGKRAEVLALLGVFAFTLLASALHKYPFVGRLLLFLVPVAVVLVAHGTAAVAGAVWPRSKLAAVLVVGLVVYAPAVEVLNQARHPFREEDVPAALKVVRQQWQPGDRIYVYNGDSDVGAGPAFEWYTRGDQFAPDAVVRGGLHRDDARGYQAEVNAVARRTGRVWVLFAHQHEDEQAWIRGYFDAVADRGGEFVDPGRGVRTSVFLYTIHPR